MAILFFIPVNELVKWGCKDHTGKSQLTETELTECEKHVPIYQGDKRSCFGFNVKIDCKQRRFMVSEPKKYQCTYRCYGVVTEEAPTISNILEGFFWKFASILFALGLLGSY